MDETTLELDREDDFKVNMGELDANYKMIIISVVTFNIYLSYLHHQINYYPLIN